MLGGKWGPSIIKLNQDCYVILYNSEILYSIDQHL